MPIYAYCEPEEQQCRHGADAPTVFVFVERGQAIDLQNPEFVEFPDFTFEDETVRTESAVARIEVLSNTPPPIRYFCPYRFERRLGRYFIRDNKKDQEVSQAPHRGLLFYYKAMFGVIFAGIIHMIIIRR